MLAHIIGKQEASYRAINTDHETGGPSLPVTIAQEPEDSGDRIWVLDTVHYSYKPQQGNPKIEGGIQIKVGDNVKFDADIPDFTGVLNLYIPSQTDKVISVTLRPGGSGVIGKLNCAWHLEPAV